MLTLNDGRSELWQWDTGRTLNVDAECSQVHFSNKVFGRSIDVDVIDGVATIPDVLLQTDRDLIAWAFVGTAENGYTKISKVFKVNKRNKPADYVFTPPEQTTLEEIMERLDDLESMQNPDTIKNAVDEYLKQNPVDFPVDSVNGKFGDVNLSAEDVDALPKDASVVKTVNGTSPDSNGNVEITIPDSGQNGNGLSTTAANLLIEILESAVYSTNVSGKIASLKETLASGGGSGGGDTPDVPDDPDEPVVDEITVSDGVMTIVSVGSAITVSDGAMTIA